MTINRSDIPSPSAPNFTAKMREAMMTYLGRQGDPLDRGLTLRDMIESGLIQLRSGFSLRNTSGTIPLEPGPNVGSDAKDLTPPPQPTGFAVSAGISYIFVEHDHPIYTAGHGHLRTRLYGTTWTSGPLPTFADAIEIGQFSADVYSHPTNPATTWHLWIKWETVDGVLSPTPAGGANGLVATTGQDVALLLDALNGQIRASELNADLSARIDLVDGSGVGSVNARLLAETNARNSAIATEAQARVDGIAAEAAFRAQALLDEAAARGDLGTTLSTAISDEASARVSGDSAEATSRNLLATQLRGAYEGSDLSQVTTGLIYTERIARSAGDNSLAQQIALLSAGSGEQFDWSEIWYFDADIESWSGNGTPTAADGFIRPANQASGAYIASPAGLDVDGEKYPQIRLRFRKTGAPTFAGFLWWKNVGDSVWSTGKRIALTEPSYIDGIGLITGNMGWTGTIDQIRLDLSSAQTGTDYFDVDWVAIGRPSPGASSAQLLEEQVARASGDSAEATARQTLSSLLVGQNDPTGLTLSTLTSGIIYDERTTRSSADGALSTSISTLSSTVTGNYNTLSGAITNEATARSEGDSAEATARETLSSAILGATNPDGLTLANLTAGLIYDERVTRSSADSSLSQSISVVSATANAKNKTYLQPTAPTVGLVAGDVWYDSDDANKSYRWTGSLWQATADTRISANAAAIVSEQTARANGDSALATSISTLSSTVDANTAAISSEATTRASQTGELYAKYTVKIDVNGYVSGFGLASTANNGTPTSQFIFKADQFAFGAPGLTTAYPFVIQASATTANGVAVPAGVYIDAAYIKNGTITAAKIGNAVIDNAKISDLNAAKINAGTLSADRIAAGSITADKIDTRNLTVKDANGNILLGSGTALNWSNLTGQPTGIYNSNITISSSGQLSGAGGGQVTIGGLGYSGDLNATYGADFNTNVENVPANDQFLNNLVDSTTWVPGQSPPWATNGNQTQSVIVFGSGPRGAQVPLWECRSEGTNTANGGWNPDSSNSFSIDTSKTYRFAVPVKRLFGTSGTAYWGIQQSTVCNLNTTTVNTNPYFETMPGSSMVLGRWYLLVGYVYPEGSSGLTNDGSGTYDMVTGQLVSGGTNFCWKSGATSTGTRAYLYYSTLATDRLQFAPPMVHAITGTEPSMTELLSTTSFLNSAITINADGTLSNAGGGQATLSGMGAGPFATLDQINDGNIGTYISTAAIGGAYIKNASINQAHINGAIIGSAQILDGAITSAKIGNAEISTAKIQDAAITAAKIGSIALVGTNNFSVKSATAGARMEMDSRVIKVYDGAGVLRVRIGDLTA